MFDVTGGAIWHVGADLVFVVHRAVVAREAGGVGGLEGEFAGFLNVAGGALFFEHGVRLAHASAGINAGITRVAAPGDPANCEEWSENDEDEPGALERSGALEIVQVNALGDGFGCA